MMATDELRAWYGPDHVALAVDRGAVGTLLISDDLFRCIILFFEECRKLIGCLIGQVTP